METKKKNQLESYFTIKRIPEEKSAIIQTVKSDANFYVIRRTKPRSRFFFSNGGKIGTRYNTACFTFAYLRQTSYAKQLTRRCENARAFVHGRANAILGGNFCFQWFVQLGTCVILFSPYRKTNHPCPLSLRHHLVCVRNDGDGLVACYLAMFNYISNDKRVAAYRLRTKDLNYLRRKKNKREETRRENEKKTERAPLIFRERFHVSFKFSSLAIRVEEKHFRTYYFFSTAARCCTSIRQIGTRCRYIMGYVSRFSFISNALRTRVTLREFVDIQRPLRSPLR